MSFWQITLQLLEGFGYTLVIFGVTLAAAIPLGLLIALGSMSRFRPVCVPCRGLVWIIRGTPLMLQIIVFAYGPGLWLDIPIRTIQEQMLMVCIAFAINYACYFSEIFRGGIESISRGQYEAGQVLGMTRGQIFKNIVLLQVIKRIVPPMSNEIITLVKDTALANAILVSEIIMQANKLAAKAMIWPLFYAGAFYLVFVGVLTILLGKLEKKLDYFKA